MSWATISTISWSARGAGWTANFQEWNGTAASNTFKMDKPRLRRGQEDKETVAPIIESILRVRVKDTARFLHDKLQSTDYENLRLLIQKGGSDWGSYVLYKKDGGSQIVHDNPVLKLRFSGGLRRLKKLTWEVRGRYTLLRLLKHVLSETRAQFPARIYMQWATANTDLTSRGESQAMQLVSDDLATNKTVTDYFDVLRELCACFNLQVVQYNGRWHVIQRSYRDREMSWEQRDTSGTETTGTFDPRLTQAQSQLLSWEDKYPEGRNREPVPAIRRRFEYTKGNFQNVNFTDTYTTLGGTQDWVGWHESSGNVSESSTGNPLLETGINQSTPEMIEQSAEKIFQDGTADEEGDQGSLTVGITVTAQATPDAPKTVDMPYLEVMRRQKVDGTLDVEWWSPSQGGWTSTQHYLTAPVEIPSGGTETTTHSFTNLPTIDFEPTLHDQYEIVVRCLMEQDTDQDGINEIQSVEYEQVDFSLTKNTDTPSGEDTYVGSADAELTREVSIGGWDPDNQVAGQIRYWNGSEWDKSRQWIYGSSQGLLGNRSLSRTAVLELESQLNHDLAEVQAAVSPDGASIIDSPEIGGVRYIPSHSDEILTHERRYMEFVEYQNA